MVKKDLAGVCEPAVSNVRHFMGCAVSINHTGESRDHFGTSGSRISFSICSSALFLWAVEVKNVSFQGFIGNAKTKAKISLPYNKKGRITKCKFYGNRAIQYMYKSTTMHL